MATTTTNRAITERLEAIAEDSRRIQKLAREIGREHSPDGPAARAMMDRASELEAEDPEEASRLRARAVELLAQSPVAS